MGRRTKYPHGMVIMSISTDPETAELFEKLRGDCPRGDFLKELLEVYLAHVEEKAGV